MAADEQQRLYQLNAAWNELQHVLSCNGINSLDGAAVAALPQLEACFGQLPAITLLPQCFQSLTTLRLVQQVRGTEPRRKMDSLATNHKKKKKFTKRLFWSGQGLARQRCRRACCHSAPCLTRQRLLQCHIVSGPALGGDVLKSL